MIGITYFYCNFTLNLKLWQQPYKNNLNILLLKYIPFKRIYFFLVIALLQLEEFPIFNISTLLI